MSSRRSSSDSSLLRLVIVGDGLAGVTAAALLARALPRSRYRITLVPVARHGPDDMAWIAATLPSVRAFHAHAGLDEDSLLQQAEGSFTLGIACSGWGQASGTVFQPYGEVGAALGGVQFHQWVARLRAEGEPLNPCDYSLAAMMAQAGRFTRPSDEAASPTSTYSYGLHLRRSAYIRLLLDVAVNRGVEPAGSDFCALALGPDGRVANVALESGATIEADFFIDASEGGALARQLAGSRFVGWRDWLGCDRLLTLLCSSGSAPSPYSHLEAHACGWRHTVPGRHDIGESFAYASGLLGDEEAFRTLASNLLGSIASEPQVRGFEPGRLERPWTGNCVALGSAAALIEPGSPLDLHLLHSAVSRLVKLIPVSTQCEVERREYNRLTIQALDGARDFAIARYALNSRRGEPFWNSVRDRPLPGPLEHKIALYRSRGRVPLIDGDLFGEAEWALLFDSLGLRPRRHDALADAIPRAELQRQLARLRQALIGAVKAMPSHGEYLHRLSHKAAA